MPPKGSKRAKAQAKSVAEDADAVVDTKGEENGGEADDLMQVNDEEINAVIELSASSSSSQKED